MKKNYFTLLAAILFVGFTNAQTTIYSTDFDATYQGVAAVEANLNDHPDWKAGHFANATTFTAATTGDSRTVVQTGSHFSYALLENTPIVAAVGDVITIKFLTDIGLADQAYGTADNNLDYVGLLNKNNPAAGSQANGNHRDGIMLFNKGTSSEVAVRSAGGGAFDAATGIVDVDLTNRSYEVIIEYTVGADAATSTKNAKITNVATSVTSTTDIATGMNASVYTELTGSGAYFFNWPLNFGKNDSDINILKMESLEITKNGGVLSTQSFNNFEFSMSPNPVNDFLTINSKETIKTVEIFNLLGKKVLSTTNNSLSVSSLSKSVYLVKITSDKCVSTKKLIKN